MAIENREVRKAILKSSENVRRDLLKAPRLLESGDLRSQAEGLEIILRAIDHIEWVDRFFYDVIDLRKKNKD